jgi:hypothetical protein
MASEMQIAAMRVMTAIRRERASERASEGIVRDRHVSSVRVGDQMYT